MTANKESIHDLLNTLPQIVVETDLKGNLVFVNQKTYEITGYTPEDLANGMNAIEFVVPEERPKVKENMQRILNGETLQGNEYQALKKDGSTYPVQVYSSYRLDNEKPIGMRSIIIDITDHKKAEEKIIESERRFKELAELLPEAVFESDLAVNLTYVNQQAYKLFGYSQKDFEKGICGIDLIVPEERERARENIARKLQGEDVGSIEYRAINKEGKVFPILLHSSLIVIRGSVIGLRGIIIDITKLKQAEENLKEYKDKLEEKVAERTEELQTLVNAFARRENQIIELKEVIKKLHRQLKDAGMTPVADSPLKRNL